MLTRRAGIGPRLHHRLLHMARPSPYTFEWWEDISFHLCETQLHKIVTGNKFLPIMPEITTVSNGRSTKLLPLRNGCLQLHTHYQTINSKSQTFSTRGLFVTTTTGPTAACDCMHEMSIKRIHHLFFKELTIL